MNMDGDRNNTCAICKTNQQKYRCPTCRIVYCSVTCYKNHKTEDSCVKKEEDHVQLPSQEHYPNSNSKREDGEISSEENSETEADEDHLKPWQLQSLGKSKAVKSLLQNHHLREMILHLDQVEDKVKAIEGAMQEPIFVEFADACLSATQSNEASPLMER